MTPPRLSHHALVTLVPLLTPLALLGCGAPPPPASIARTGTPSDFHVVAEGPCSRLSVQTIGNHVFVVYGDTGYDLHDWAVGERLAAAESAVEIRDGEAFRVPAMFEGLPRTSGGYVPADLRLGGAFDTRAWLVAVDTRYAPRGRGVLFEREAQSYVLEGARWAPSGDARVPLELPFDVSLPRLPEPEMCPPPSRFVKLASATHARGTVIFAGRCEEDGPVPVSRSVIWTARIEASTPNARWATSKLPDSDALEGTVNVSMWLRTPDDVYVAAYEPFKRPEARRPYLARFDGSAWSSIETGIPDGLMSISGADDGTLWIAAGRALYERRPGRAFAPVVLPDLRHASEARPSTLRIHTVRVVAGDDVWVEGTYRVRARQPNEPEPTELRAAVLFRSRPGASHVCDARERADRAFAREAP